MSVHRVIHEHVCLGELPPDEEQAREYHGCLKHAQTWQGKCSQKTVHQTVFRRRQKACDFNLNAREHLKVEEWKQENTPVRSGCECRLKYISKLREFVGEGL